MYVLQSPGLKYQVLQMQAFTNISTVRQVLDVVEAFDPEMGFLDDQPGQLGQVGPLVILFPPNEW